MNNGGVGRQLKGHLQIAAEVGLAQALGDFVTLPGGADDFVNEGRHGDGAVLTGDVASVVGQDSAALGVAAGLHILSICLDILRHGTDLFKGHFFSLLFLKSFGNLTIARSDSGTEIVALGFCGLAGLDLLIDGTHFVLKRVQIGFGRVKLTGNSGAAFQKLVNSHVFQFH